jgi:hypothetical protein
LRPPGKIVSETISGTRRAPEANSWSIAKSAALQFRESKQVSTRSRSAPPSSRPFTCSA